MKMNEHYYAVIMAGGGGTRLWPLSRRSRPKQMLNLGGELTLFQNAVKRLEGLFPPERILVVTVANQATGLQQQVPQIPRENYLLEPMQRGTASVVGLAAQVLSGRDPEATMAILTADHFIGNVPSFQSLLCAAYDVAQKNYLVTLGITPTFASTGYGYVQRDAAIGDFCGLTAYQVLRFREKPNEAAAKEMVERGDHFWNSGMFIWRVDRILADIQKWMPDLRAHLQIIGQAWDGAQRDEVFQAEWPLLKNETIDYGIMERAEQVAVLPGSDLGWNDVGSWDSLFSVLPADENGNMIVNANALALDTHSTLVCSEGPTSANSNDRLIVTVGLEDMIVVDTGNAVLICRKEDAQKVKKVVDLLKGMGKDQYL
jgi:mannose-1-phosphate guanylyltransferase